MTSINLDDQQTSPHAKVKCGLLVMSIKAVQ